jgi:hypothetical protein
MFKQIDASFVVAGLVFVCSGMVLGEMMASSQDHAQLPTHAHLNLAGGVFGLLFGLAYRAWPSLKGGALPALHLILHVVGVLVMTAGLWLMFGGMGETALPIALATAGSLAVLAGALIFLFLFVTRAFKAT